MLDKRDGFGIYEVRSCCQQLERTMEALRKQAGIEGSMRGWNSPGDGVGDERKRECQQENLPQQSSFTKNQVVKCEVDFGGVVLLERLCSTVKEVVLYLARPKQDSLGHKSTDHQLSQLCTDVTRPQVLPKWPTACTKQRCRLIKQQMPRNIDLSNNHRTALETIDFFIE